eukprot:3944950-Amphidinium_carterae.3
MSLPFKRHSEGRAHQVSEPEEARIPNDSKLYHLAGVKEEFSEVAQRVQAAGGVERPPVVDLEGKIRNLGPTLKLHAARWPWLE